MIVYVIRRILFIPVVLALSFLAGFTLLWLTPGGPLDAYATQPPPIVTLHPCERSAPFLSLALSALGNWGTLQVDACTGLSMESGQAILPVIATAAPTTLALVALALVLAVALGTGGGIALVATRKQPWHRHVRTALLTLESVPAYVVGPAFVVVGAFGLAAFSPSQPRGMEFVVPALSLALAFAAGLARAVAGVLSSTSDELRSAAARARGISHARRQLHRARFVGLATVAWVPDTLGALTMGAIAVEHIFEMRGLGSVVTHAIAVGDMTSVLGAALTYALLMLLANVAVATLYVALDPRVRRRA